MSEETTLPEAEPSHEDYAAREYQVLLPKFRKEIEDLSARQSKAVLVALMEYPLEKAEFHWSYPQEQRAFITGAQILDCRFVLMKAILDLTTEERRAILEETKDDIIPKEEINNGTV